MTKLFYCLLILLAVSCTLAPSYKTPKSPIILEEDEEKMIMLESFVLSEEIKDLIQKTLANNRNLKLAVINVENFRAQYGIARSALIPSIGASGSYYKTNAKTSLSPEYSAGVAITNYELDIFGRIRSLKKNVSEKMLAAEEEKNVIKVALVAEAINLYLQLTTDKENLQITQELLKLEEEKALIAERQFKNGLTSELSFLQTKASLIQAKNLTTSYESIVEKNKNALMLLAGTEEINEILNSNTGIDSIGLSDAWTKNKPSAILLLRPDIKMAEHNLKAANASIGTARAAFFPSITLTSQIGYASNELSSLFSNSAWVFSPQINVPIFTSGKNKANLNLAVLQKDANIIKYEQAIQTAFFEASNALAEKRRTNVNLKSAKNILTLQQKNYNLANNRFTQGLISNADFIAAQQALLNAKLNYNNAKKESLSSLVSLYKVFGGGVEF